MRQPFLWQPFLRRALSENERPLFCKKQRSFLWKKTDKLYVVPADFGWDDVGSWMALERYLTKDEYGNVTKGEVQAENANNNTVFVTTWSYVKI